MNCSLVGTRISNESMYIETNDQQQRYLKQKKAKKKKNERTNVIGFGLFGFIPSHSRSVIRMRVSLQF